ncbi:MAG: 50S ribosomal protein L20 [Candidatus Doudnabacteria bacterium RIFCSPHIGHO2_02_FULL_46_11]|uniref:Large ribosomal subunit protein bL20 n=1 Tax=Candidatus Doudnabacteria bacterium RIFCSPHIGHO2_02_FULL_46_11 TaxID=1817832 RepID=A0A1F5P4Q3_9BACT|nr:MAG: 50S ribosomal protein L20 [Candidatus Doudnabacteria bacterium RIFCSPHIGHO2_02_FULL_46_11]
MARVKRGTNRIKRRKNVLKRASGFLNRRSTHLRAAREALLHAEKYAYRDRRAKKRDMRSLWIVRLSAAAKEQGMSYSTLMNKLKKAKVEINRKMLAEIAVTQPEVFKKIIAQI